MAALGNPIEVGELASALQSANSLKDEDWMTAGTLQEMKRVLTRPLAPSTAGDAFLSLEKISALGPGEADGCCSVSTCERTLRLSHETRWSQRLCDGEQTNALRQA